MFSAVNDNVYANGTIQQLKYVLALVARFLVCKTKCYSVTVATLRACNIEFSDCGDAARI